MPDQDSFCLPVNYSARSEPCYFIDADGEQDSALVWQPDVYGTAGRVAEVVGARSLIDVGCGRGRKLAEFQDRFNLVGIDFGSNLEYCRIHYPAMRCLEADLEHCTQVDVPAEQLASSVIVCSDVIEHLVNPLPLLVLLRSLLKTAPFAVISTPDRLVTRGVLHRGPPLNPHHMREWSLGELKRLAEREGLSVCHHTLTRTHNQSDQRKTSLLLLKGANVADEVVSRAKEVLPAEIPQLRYTWTVLDRTRRVSFEGEKPVAHSKEKA